MRILVLGFLLSYAATANAWYLTASTCKLKWQPSPDEALGNVEGYAVHITAEDPYSVSVVDVGLVNEVSCSEVNAVAGRNTATVRAFNGYGESPDSNAVSFLIVTQAPEPPPVSGMGELLMLNDCTVSWDPSPQEAEFKVGGYKLILSEDEAFTNPRTVDVGLVNSVSCEDIDAALGKTYMKIVAYNPAGTSVESNTTFFVIWDKVPQAAVSLVVVDE